MLLLPMTFQKSIILGVGRNSENGVQGMKHKLDDFGRGEYIWARDMACDGNLL